MTKRYSPEVLSGMSKILRMLQSSSNAMLPDPKVSAIIYDCAGNIVAQYSKSKFGEPHSEVQVVIRAFEKLVKNVAKNDKKHEEVNGLLLKLKKKFRSPGSLKCEDDLFELRELSQLLLSPLKSAVLFVNLEPCSHFGKNPACASVIAAAGIGTVHFAHFDPDPDVQGKGLNILKAHKLQVSAGCLESETMNENRLFLQIDSFMPRLFGGIHPSADHKISPHVMLGLLVPDSEIRTKNSGKSVSVHTFGVPPKRTTVAKIPSSGRPRVLPKTVQELPYHKSSVLFATLLNPPAIVDMIRNKFKVIPGSIVAAIPDMSFEYGKEECMKVLQEYFPKSQICVGVRMASIQDKLAHISLRRRLMVERKKQGLIAIVVLAKGVPQDQKARIETRFVQLVSATTIHISKFEEYLVMLRFLRDDIKITIYLAGDLHSGRNPTETINDLKKLLVARKRVSVKCVEEDFVLALKAAKVPRVKYLEPYWEIV